MPASLSFEPVFSPVLIGLLALGLALLAWGVARRSRLLVGRTRSALAFLLRMVFIAGLASILMRPMIESPQQRPTAWPTLSILLDGSASMQTEDAGSASRTRAAAAALASAREAIIGGLGRQAIVKCYTFAEQLKPALYDQLAAGETPTGEQTDLAGALLAAAETGGARQAGMLVISDGRVNQSSGSGGVIQAARYLSARKIPVWTATVGTDSKTRDAYVMARLTQNFLYVRQPGSIQATVDQAGYKDWRATVRLLREGVEVAAQQTVLGEGPVDLSFPITEPTPGLFAYEVRVDPLPREADAENNRRMVYVRATDRKTQVLLVEAEPYWDTKFLLRAVGKDPNLEVTALFQMNKRKTLATRQTAESPAVGRDPNPPAPVVARIPRTREELFAYDVIILGRGADRLWDANEMKLFREYLTERGGNLIFARGRAYDDPSSELAALEPVVWGEGKVRDVRMALTDKGRSVTPLSERKDGEKDPNMVIRELPTLLSVTRVEQEKSLAVVLARTESGTPGAQIAVLSWQRYGKGKVMSVGSAGLWRWELAPMHEEKLQGVYNDFWRQLVQWMASYSDFLPDQQITFEVNRNTFRLGDQVRLTVRTRLDDPKSYRPALELIRRGGEATRLELETDPNEPCQLNCSYVPDAEGDYEVRLRNNIGEPKEDVVRFTVYQDSTERRITAANAGLMGQIARVTGGETLTLDQLRELPDRLSQFEQQTSIRRKPVDAWDEPLVFYLLTGLVSLEWLIRRLSGLV